MSCSYCGKSFKEREFNFTQYCPNHTCLPVWVNLLSLACPQIVVGSKGLSHSQEQVQMAMWAMFAAPLMLSADLREVTPESRAIMTNKAVIAINQDALGKQAKMVKTVSYFILSLLIG